MMLKSNTTKNRKTRGGKRQHLHNFMEKLIEDFCLVFIVVLVKMEKKVQHVEGCLQVHSLVFTAVPVLRM